MYFYLWLRVDCQQYSEYRYEQKWTDGWLADQSGYWRKVLNCVKVETLISGGAVTEAKEYPHMVSSFNLPIPKVHTTIPAEKIVREYLMAKLH